MTKGLPRRALLLLGVVLAAFCVQHAVDVDGPTAADSAPVQAVHVVQAPAGPQSAAASDEIASSSRPAAALASDSRKRPTLRMPRTTEGSVGDVTSRLTPLVGVSRVLQGQTQEPMVVELTGVPLVFLTEPTSEGVQASAAAEASCKSQDLQVQAQGVTADLAFVGVLLTGTERQDQQFSRVELDALKIVVQWSNLFSNHRQRLELMTPDGSVYQSLSRQLTVTDSAAPVAISVPVSGSWITRYGLYGSWCVDLFFDQDEKPVASGRVVISG